MKISKYNYHIPLENDIVLMYNSFSGAYTILHERVHKAFIENSNNVNTFAEQYPTTYKALCDNSYIVEHSKDEFAAVLNYRLQRKYSSLQYDLTINPTMNCNLNCWYCYESHIKSSNMTLAAADKLIKHIKLQHEINNYKLLNVSFFGGEPLLNKNVIKYLLDNISEYTNENSIMLSVSFTTNGTSVNTDILSFLKTYKVHFQITLDGNKQKHDSIRKYKNTNVGSYQTIIAAIAKINKELENYFITLRINYDAESLISLKDIINDIDALPREKIAISLNKVWQVNSESIVIEDVIDFISYANTHKFKVLYKPINGVVSHVCYADNLNQAVVNYNGDVFKCTARNFTKENKEGSLENNGEIVWNTNKVLKRIDTYTPSICKNCKFFPSCKNMCSQSKLELNQEFKCKMFDDLTAEEIILLNYNQLSLSN